MIQPVVASAIFLISLWLIFSEKINRVIVSLSGAFLMVSAGIVLDFYSQEQAIQSIDFNTLGLLLGMMVLVSLLEPTGFFQYLAVWAGRISKGRPGRLLVLMGTITTILSMLLDNVTTVVLIAPITILICEILGFNPTPFLMAEALLSDTGGVATLVGDPPNVLIASAAGFSFTDFLTHALPVVVVAWFAALLLIQFLFKQDLQQVSENIDALQQLSLKEALEDRKTAVRVLITLVAALCVFFMQEALNVTPAFIALGAATVALFWIRPNVRDTFARIEWSVLIFFAALFVMVGGMEGAGVLSGLARLLTKFSEFPQVWLGILIIWVVAVLSAVVDNIPITIAVIPVILELGEIGLNIEPLWWALAFGAGFGGNGTIIGSTANIVVATLSEKTHTPITPKLWNRRGLPVMLTTCLVASVLYFLFYPIFTQ